MHLNYSSGEATLAVGELLKFKDRYSCEVDLFYSPVNVRVVSIDIWRYDLVIA